MSRRNQQSPSQDRQSHSKGHRPRGRRDNTRPPQRRSSPDASTTESDDPTISRRDVLNTVGAVGVTSVGIMAAAGRAGPPSFGGGNSPCEEGALLAKYEVEDGEFVFEKGRDSLNIDGDEISLSITDTKEDSEILGFHWESNPAGIFDVTCVRVKTGEGVYEQCGDWRTSGDFHVQNHDDSDPLQAISWVSFCMSDVFWQVDFATDAAYPFDDDLDWTEHYEGGPFLAAAVKEESGIVNLKGSNFHDGVSLQGNEFDIDSGSVTARFTVEHEITLNLASFELPGPWKRSEIDGSSFLYQVKERTFEPGEVHELTVDIPHI